MMIKILFTFSLFALLISCAPSGRYQQHKDSIPSRIPTAAELKDAVPRMEAKSRGGNKHYSVLGQYYQVLDSAENFTEQGIASFYGEKFHGHLTSNGEIYNMYSMSAAHKHLPLPSYVKVTNLTNNRTVIVRVNDRGPFHEGRIIDLSYAAAYKLGISGTAPVKIEAITQFSNPHSLPKQRIHQSTRQSESVITPLNKAEQTLNSATISSKTPTSNVAENTIAQTLPTQTEEKLQYIQVLATSNKTAAINLSKTLSKAYQKPVIVSFEQGLHKVLMGPFESTGERYLTQQNLKRSGYKNAFSKEMFQP